MASFKMEIVTPERMVYSGEVESVRAPGSEGSFGVLARHVPLLTSLQVGSLVFRESGGASRQAAVSGGFVEVRPDGVTVLAETAELAEEIDVERARSARDRARGRLNTPAAEIDEVRARIALSRALNRLKVAGGL